MFIPQGTPLSGRSMDRFGHVVPGIHQDAFRPETAMERREELIRHDINKRLYEEPVKPLGGLRTSL